VDPSVTGPAWARVRCALRRPGGLVSLSIIGQLLGMLVTLLAARLLDAAHFSAYAVASALFILLATTAPLGSEKHALRHLPAMVDAGQFGEARGLLDFGLRRTLGMALLSAAAVIGWAMLTLDPGPERAAILVTCLSLPAGALCHYGVEAVTAQDRPALAMLLFRVVVPGCALLLVGLALLLNAQVSGAFVVGAWGLGWLLALGALAMAFRAAAPQALRSASIRQSPSVWRAEARPFIAYRLSMSLLAQSPILMLGLLDAPPSDIGIYAAAASTAGLLTVLATATNRAYGRELGLLLGREDFQGIARLRHGRRRWMLPLVAVLLVLLALFAEQVLALFQPRFAESGQWPLRILALANAVTVLLALAPTMLKFRGDRRMTYAILIGAAAGQLLALLLLVPRFGATGAAIATLLAMIAMYGAFSAHAWQPMSALAKSGQQETRHGKGQI
jgi:O-antigen/teichoic acid export membrane protein